MTHTKKLKGHNEKDNIFKVEYIMDEKTFGKNPEISQKFIIQWSCTNMVNDKNGY